MKKILAVALLVAIAFFSWGFGDNVSTTYIQHKVKAGETLNGIAKTYYTLNTKNYIELDDYSLMVRVKNNKLHNLERKLQIGDVVIVPVYTVKR